MLKVIAKLHLWLNASQVGADQFGNKYYVLKKLNPDNGKQVRSVMYAGTIETSKVPPLWHAWLHYLCDEIPSNAETKGYMPNLTGTKHAYRPVGHILNGGVRGKVESDYIAWDPNN